MDDMNPADIVGEYSECVLTYYDNTSRKVLVTNTETPFPDGKLIVSRTDKDGIITHVNQALIEISGFNEQELVGQPHCIIRHPDMPNSLTKIFGRLLIVVKNGLDMLRTCVKTEGSIGSMRLLFQTFETARLSVTPPYGASHHA